MHDRIKKRCRKEETTIPLVSRPDQVISVVSPDKAIVLISKPDHIISLLRPDKVIVLVSNSDQVISFNSKTR